MKDFLFILQFDSFVSAMLPVIKSLNAAGKGTDIICMLRFGEKNWISRQIEEQLKGLEWETLREGQIYHRLKRNYPVVVIASTPRPFFEKFTKYAYENGLQSRFASGYIGLLLQRHPQRFLKGVRRRALTDLIWTPGEESRQRLLRTGLINTWKTRVIASGVPRFDQFFQDFEKNDRSIKVQQQRPVLLFLEQPTFPKSFRERRELTEKLFTLAEKHADWDLQIKPRFTEKTGHTHQPKHYIHELFNEMKKTRDIPNISIVSGNVYTLITQASLVTSISSTAALEAALSGKAVVFFNDFCGTENRYGSEDFKELGQNRSLDWLADADLNTVLAETDTDTLKLKAQHILKFDGHNTEDLSSALLELLENKNSESDSFRSKIRQPKKIYFLGRKKGILPLSDILPLRENWRKLEYETFRSLDFIQECRSVSRADIILCRNKPENTSLKQRRRMSGKLKKRKSTALLINSVDSFDNHDLKEQSFKLWSESGLSVPDHILLEDSESAAAEQLSAFQRQHGSFLLRSNNETGSKGIQLIHAGTEKEQMLQILRTSFERLRNPDRRKDTRLMAVEYVSGSDADAGWNTVFRVHVSCGELISGYAACSRRSLFHVRDMRMEDMDMFIRKNALLSMKMQTGEWNEHILRSLRSLGVELGAVGFFETASGLVFLELNTMWGGKHVFGDSAYTEALLDRRSELEKRIPNVYRWLEPRYIYSKLYASAVLDAERRFL